MKIDLRNRLLLVGVALLLFASYRLAVRRTVEAVGEYRFLSSQGSAVGDVAQQLAMMHQKERYYDSVLARMDLGGTSMQNNLLKALNLESERNKIDIVGFGAPHVLDNGDGQVQTFSFHLKGSFTGILKTVHSLEQKGSFGEIVHLDFEKREDRRAKAPYLEAMVLAQCRN